MEVFEVKSGSLKRQGSSTPPPRSRMSCLLVFAGIAFVTSFTLILFNFLIGHKQLTEELELIQSVSKETLLDLRCESEFCTSKSCIITASRLIDIMDASADPCQDFYQYACGGYKKKRTVRYLEDFYSPIKESLDNILVNIKRLMEKPFAEDESEALKKTKLLFGLCMNTSQRNEMNMQSLGSFLSHVQLHVMNSIPEEGEDEVQLENYGSWRLVLSKLEEYQIHTVFKPDFKMSETGSLERIEVDCLIPMLPPETYLSPAEEEHAYHLMLYQEVINKAFEVMSIDSEIRKKYVEEFIQLETEISRAIRRSPKPDIPALSVEHKQQLKEIWRPLIGEIGFDVEVKSTCQYNLENMMAVLNNVPSETSARYVIWRMMSRLMQYMGNDFLNLHLHYLGRLPGSEYGFVSPWRQCSDMVRKEMGLVVAKGLFDEGYFTAEQLAEMKEMFWELKTDFGHILRMMPWLDDVTRGVFLEKLKSVKFITGYPGEINATADLLDAVFGEFDINATNSYFLNIMELHRFKTQHFYRSLTRGNQEESESDISLLHNPLGTSSGYDYIKNTVSVDLGLFRSPLFHFSDSFPKFLKYGQAVLMAHELSHAFDAIGNFYDGYGNKMDLDWWPSVVGQKFNEFAHCLAGQHAGLTRNVPPPVANVTKIETLNNIIADLGSFFVTYAGFAMHLQAHGNDEKPIPGVNLTKKQTYFLQAAQTFCELRQKPSLDPNAKYVMPPNIRVNGAVMNTEDFGVIFDCPVGAPMNPERKCNLLH